MCLHFEIRIVCLLKVLFPLNNAISSFSFRQSLHLSDDRLKREYFLRILHFNWGTEFHVPYAVALSFVWTWSILM